VADPEFSNRGGDAEGVETQGRGAVDAERGGVWEGGYAPSAEKF